MIASRVRDLERSSELREERIGSSLRTFEATMEDQKTGIYRLEDLLYRTMHRDHVSRPGADSPASLYAGNL
ncbi:hypothetical protein F4801DRAFT_581582 [Xylaria longipes]|nr:hypothetical protein F4801DRAFT_581582 [Xylaria longipes]